MTCAGGCSGGACVCRVASAGGGQTSIAIDGARGVHVSYYDSINKYLKYAYRPDGGSWTTTTIDSGWYIGEYTSIALDGAGGVHVSYYGALKYAYRPAGGSWTTPTTVDSAGEVGRYSSIAVDATGGVHVSYLYGTDDDLKYTYRAGCP